MLLAYDALEKQIFLYKYISFSTDVTPKNFVYRLKKKLKFRTGFFLMNLYKTSRLY